MSHSKASAIRARAMPTSYSNIGNITIESKAINALRRMPRTPISPHTALPLCRAKCSDHPSGTRMHSVVRTRVPHPLDILTLTYSADNCPSANTVSSSHSKASIIRASAMPTSYSTLVTSPSSPKQLMHFAKMPWPPMSPHTALPPCRAKCRDHPSGTRMHSVVRTRVSD
jgi:hypothetical protein